MDWEDEKQMYILKCKHIFRMKDELYVCTKCRIQLTIQQFREYRGKEGLN